MELKQLTDRVFYSMFDKTADRPVLGYVNGQKYSFMIDAGNSQKHVELFYEALCRKGLKKPDITAVTHWHWDHTFGMHGVDYYNNCYLDKEKPRSLITSMEGFDFDICVMGHAEPMSKQNILSIMNSLMEP